MDRTDALLLGAAGMAIGIVVALGCFALLVLIAVQEITARREARAARRRPRLSPLFDPRDRWPS